MVRLVFLLAVPATVGALALAAQPSSSHVAMARVVQSTGAVSGANSREDLPILTASNLLPGQSATGTVTIANTAADLRTMTLVQTAPQDVPGPLGAKLSGRLDLTVTDQTDPAAPRTVYDGSLPGLSTRALGDFGPREARTYRFTARRAQDAGEDLSGSSTSVGYEWVAEESSPTGAAGGANGDGGPTSGTGSPGSQDQPLASRADRRAPHVDLRLVSDTGSLRQHRIVVRSRCDEDCQATVDASVSIASVHRAVPFTRHRVQLRAHRTVATTLKVGRGLDKLLRRAKRDHHAVRLRVRTLHRDRAGNTTTTRRSARLRR